MMYNNKKCSHLVSLALISHFATLKLDSTLYPAVFRAAAAKSRRRAPSMNKQKLLVRAKFSPHNTYRGAPIYKPNFHLRNPSTSHMTYFFPQVQHIIPSTGCPRSHELSLSRIMSEYDLTDASAGYSTHTPPERTITKLDELLSVSSLPRTKNRFQPSFPWPGFTFIIREVPSKRVISLQEGQVVLVESESDDCKSTHWECVENKGWLGFRNPVSGKWLGHWTDDEIICSQPDHLGWEFFCARRISPEGGYVLLMRNGDDELWPVVIRPGHEGAMLAKANKRVGDGLVWEFIKVQRAGCL